MVDTGKSREKRIHPRFQVNVPVRYRVIEHETDSTTVSDRQKKIRTCHTGDLSLSGLFLVCDQALAVDTLLKLDISIPEIPLKITAFAMVVWTNLRGVGLHFEAIKNEDIITLRNYLSQAPPENKN